MLVFNMLVFNMLVFNMLVFNMLVFNMHRLTWVMDIHAHSHHRYGASHVLLSNAYNCNMVYKYMGRLLNNALL